MFLGRRSLFDLTCGVDEISTVKWGFHFIFLKAGGLVPSSGSSSLSHTIVMFPAVFWGIFKISCYKLLHSGKLIRWHLKIDHWKIGDSTKKTKQNNTKKVGQSKTNQPKQTKKANQTNPTGHWTPTVFLGPFCRSFSTWGHLEPFSDGSFLLQPWWIFHWTMVVYQRVQPPKN